jgi:protein O-GlcNAc transferase
MNSHLSKLLVAISSSAAQKALSADVLNQPEALSFLRQLYEEIAAAGVEIQDFGLDSWLIALGAEFQSLGRLEESSAAWECAALLQPQNPSLFSNIAVIKLRLKRPKEAVPFASAAVTQDPSYAQGWYNLGRIIKENGDFEEAEKCYRRALSIDPGFTDALNSLGVLLTHVARFAEALECYDLVLLSEPGRADVRFNRANILLSLGRTDEAVTCLSILVKEQPAFSAAWNNLGLARLRQGLPSLAIEAYNRGIEIAPQSDELICNLGSALLALGDTGAAYECFKKALTLNPGNHLCRSNLCFASWYLPELDFEHVQAEHLRWGESFATAQHSKTFSRAGSHARIKVGYVSHSYRSQAIAYFLYPAIKHHDRAQFEVYCYSDSRQHDGWTARFQQAAEHWVEIAPLADEEVAARIERDEIDILIDTIGHTDHSRLRVFAEAPAPLQINLAGYPFTLGLNSVAYRISDRIVDPDPLRFAGSELPLYIAPCLFCYASEPQSPDAIRAGRLPNDNIIFGSFNAIPKLNTEVIECWSTILTQAPGSKLMLKYRVLNDPAARSLLECRFERFSIEPSRLVLLGSDADFSAHLERYKMVDIALDPFPFNGMATTFEALWMSTPVITLAGDLPYARIGASALSALGFPELVSNSRNEYIDCAVRLANDPGRLQSYHSIIRERFCASALYDGKTYTRQLEKAYLKAWASTR